MLSGSVFISTAIRRHVKPQFAYPVKRDQELDKAPNPTAISIELLSFYPWVLVSPDILSSSS